MQQLPTLLVIGSLSDDSLLTGLTEEISLIYAKDADAVIDITSDGESIDCILLDAASLGDEAHETCLWLKTDKELKMLPIVVIEAESSQMTRWLKAGANDVLNASLPLEIFFNRIKLLIELKHKTGLLSGLAALDELTALASRQRLNEYLDIEWRRSLREYYPLSLIKIDIDGFTAFNDHYGVGVGDDVLKRLARSLEPLCKRAADMISRYGADEFVILLPAVELENALVVAEKALESVRQLNIEHSHSTVSDRITVSIGVASMEPNRDSRCQDLLDEAGEILYRAQQAGGDQVQGIAV